MKTDLRMRLPAESVAALRRHPLFCQSALSGLRKQKFHDVYFDTPERQVRAHGASLRVRGNGTRAPHIQMLAGGDRHGQGEWTTKVGGDAPDLAALRTAVGKKDRCGDLVRDAAFEKALAPVFAVYIQRTVWALRLARGDELELVLDEGFIESGAERLPVSEVQISLKTGDSAHLFDFAIELQQDIALQIHTASTTERGYRLAAAEAPAAVKAKPLALSKGMTVEQAFQCIAHNCVEQVCANHEGVAAGRDAEPVHQMRVGLRRWKSALKSFRKLMQLPEPLQKELDWITGELGAARDWDVLADTTLASVAGELAEPGQLAELHNAASHIARFKHQAAAAAVDSQRYTQLMLNLSRWIEGAGWREAKGRKKDLAAGVKPFARQLLRRDRKRLLERGKQLAGGNPAARHRVRIAGKKTRYDTEFFQSVFGKAPLRPYIKALSTLQDELGILNDATVAARLLAELSGAHRNLECSAEFVHGYLASRIHSELPAVLARWKKLAPIKLAL